MKINLQELEKALFPEFFPFYQDLFSVEREFLKSSNGLDELARQNMSFQLRLANASLSIYNRKLRESIYYVYCRLFHMTFDYYKLYDWKDLKIILCFFVLIKDTTTQRDFEKKLRSKLAAMLFAKYYHKTIWDSEK